MSNKSKRVTTKPLDIARLKKDSDQMEKILRIAISDLPNEVKLKKLAELRKTS